MEGNFALITPLLAPPNPRDIPASSSLGMLIENKLLEEFRQLGGTFPYSIPNLYHWNSIKNAHDTNKGHENSRSSHKGQSPTSANSHVVPISLVAPKFKAVDSTQEPNLYLHFTENQIHNVISVTPNAYGNMKRLRNTEKMGCYMHSEVIHETACTVGCNLINYITCTPEILKESPHVVEETSLPNWERTNFPKFE